jgi:hypothetical protein
MSIDNKDLEFMRGKMGTRTSVGTGRDLSLHGNKTVLNQISPVKNLTT